MSEEKDLTEAIRAVINQHGLDKLLNDTETPNEEKLVLNLDSEQYNKLLREVSIHDSGESPVFHDLPFVNNSINIAAGAARTGKTMIVKMIVYGALQRKMVNWDKIIVIQADTTNSWENFKTIMDNKLHIPVEIHNYRDSVSLFTRILADKRERTEASEFVNSILYKLKANEHYILTYEETRKMDEIGKKYKKLFGIMKGISRPCIIIDDMSSNTGFFRTGIMQQLPTTVSHMYATVFLILHYFTMNNKLRGAGKVLYLFKGINSLDLSYIYQSYKSSAHLRSRKDFEDLYESETSEQKYNYIILQ